MATTTDVPLDAMHVSMQFSDSKRQKVADAQAIFDRAVRRKVHWITGTEAGQEDLRTALRDAAATHGYRFTEFKSNWIAVVKTAVAKGTWKTEDFTIVPNDLTVGAGHDTSLTVVQFDHEPVGSQVTVMCSHYPRFGRPDAKDPVYRVNLEWNKKTADFIGEKAKEYGKGKSLVFYGGDQNIPDTHSDTFLGNPLTSLADELHEYPSTGHGPIDVIASYDNDGRVTGRYWRALSDKKFPLNTDHFACEGGFTVKVRAA